MVKIIIDVSVLALIIWLSERNGEKYKDLPLGYNSFVSASIYIVLIAVMQFQLISDFGKLQ